MEQASILQMKNIKKSFHGTEVLHGINLELKYGEILGLVGENGAGKSTMMNILGGVIPRDEGEIILEGNQYQPENPRDAQDSGIAFIHQELNLFSNLTVAENMFIDNFPVGGLSSVKYKQIYDKAREYIEKFSLQAQPRTRVNTLPMGSRQMLEISKALLKNSRIIIFDEPTTSLSHREKEKLFAIIKGLRQDDVSIIFISHMLEDVFALCDRISVIRDGNSIGTVTRAETDEQQVVKMMVGRELNQFFPYVEKERGEVLFETRKINCGNKVKDVSIELKSGEIVGLFGLMGAGRTEFARAVFGVDNMDSGEVLINNQPVKKITPENLISQGVAYITEDRGNEGLLLPKSVKFNLIMVKLNHLMKSLGVIDRKRAEQKAETAVEELQIKVQDKNNQTAESLSGGNQQKVVLGKWIVNSPRIFIMDEPTRGVDVGAKYEIYSIINQMAKDGSTILFISSEMQELIGVCDRILIMNQGEITADIPKKDFDQETIISYAL